jgi:hypothetical protein
VRDNERQETDRRATERRVRWNLDRLMGTARDYRGSRAERASAESAAADLEAEDPRLRDRGVTQTVRALVRGPFAILGIVGIDTLLLGGASQFLTSLVYSSDDPPMWTMFIAMPFLLLCELAFAAWAMMRAEEEQSLDPSQPRPFNVARAVCICVAIAIPAMAAAGYWTTIVGDNGSLTVSSTLLLLVIVALGIACHSYLLFGSRGMHDATIYLVHRRAWTRHHGAVNAAEARAQSHRDRARDALRGYDAALGSYRILAVNAPAHLQVTSLDAKLINDALGEEVVRVANRTGDTATVRAQPPAQNPPADTESGTAPTEEPMEPRDEDRSDVEEYLRRTVEGRQQDSDGEVRA